MLPVTIFSRSRNRFSITQFTRTVYVLVHQIYTIADNNFIPRPSLWLMFPLSCSWTRSVLHFAFLLTQSFPGSTCVVPRLLRGLTCYDWFIWIIAKDDANEHLVAECADSTPCLVWISQLLAELSFGEGPARRDRRSVLISESRCALFYFNKMDSRQCTSEEDAKPSGEENVIKPMKQFSCKEVSSWITKNFNETISAKFEGEFFFVFKQIRSLIYTDFSYIFTNMAEVILNS